MAKLNTHGSELYRKEGLCRLYSFRSNGWILINTGGGWKRYRKLADPSLAGAKASADKQRAKDIQRDADYPRCAEYRALVHSAVSIDHRWGLESMVSASPTDPLNTGADFADKHRYSDCRVVTIATMERLCSAYLAKERELDIAKSAQAVLSALTA
jgi:hypothetical protein